ncbi:MAG: aspartate-semialdehyde dehydrogenase [Holosporales bacterium]|jgi:aspartate-semialdehyde dehydrogenase|nr:aspartate-semialdehyde dehydrogenase [Holosporales bacterium]
MAQRDYRIAVVGATGIIGKTLLEVLFSRRFPVKTLAAFASSRSAGQNVLFGARSIRVEEAGQADFSAFDLAFFCVGTEVSQRHIPRATQAGCVVIDKSPVFREHPAVPLIVPELNGSILKEGAPLGIVSNPNCVAIPLSMTLEPLKAFGLKRAVVSTYQSVSGAGRDLVEALRTQAADFLREKPETLESRQPIGFNVLPLIGAREADGSSGEEVKIVQETQKILHHSFGLCVTSVRVPVFLGHGLSVVAECEREYALEEVRTRLQSLPGVELREEPFCSPREAEGGDSVFVSRLRRDASVPHGIAFWVVSDNLRKGAATNGVQIAERLIEEDPTLSLFRRKEGA